MGWTVVNLENTLRFDRAAQDELRALDDNDAVEFEDDGDRISIYFDPDHAEWIDTLTAKVREVIVRHNGTGRVTFGKVEGDGGPRFWGYDFKPGGVTLLTGEITWGRRQA